MNSQQLVERADAAAVATDITNRLLAWNEAVQEIFGFDGRSRLEGENFFSMVGARDSFGNRIPEGELAFLNMISRGEPVSGFEITAVAADNERIRMSVLPVVLLAEEEAESEIVYFLRPMLRRRRADEAIERILAKPKQALSDIGVEVGGERTVLTDRQMEILKLIAEGLSNAEIGNTLHISVNTVRTHVHDMLERLGVHSRVEAVSKGLKDGLI